MNTLKANSDTMAFARVAIADDIIKGTHVPESLSGKKMEALDAVKDLEDSLRCIATGGEE